MTVGENIRRIRQERNLTQRQLGEMVVRIIVKVLIAIVCGFIELGIFANATVPWLEGKEANKPRIRVEK